jgi:hypothetical protein
MCDCNTAGCTLQLHSTATSRIQQHESSYNGDEGTPGV